MRVTVCQMDPRPEHLPGFVAGLTSHLAESNSDLLLLPEMSFSEWLAADPVPDAGSWLDAVEVHRAHIDQHAGLGVPTVVGTRPIVDAAGSRRNEAYVWSRETDLASPVRQKYYLPNEPGYWEAAWYDRGPRSFPATRAGGVVIGIQICTEMWFLEWARHYAREAADLLCIPRATPHGTIDKWISGGRVAAVCAGAYSLSSNLWYPEGAEADCGGVGWISDPEGRLLATTSDTQPFATVDVDLDYARASKSTYPRYVPE